MLVTQQMLKDAIENELNRMRREGMTEEAICFLPSRGQQYTGITGGYLDFTNVADNLNDLLAGRPMK